MFSRRIPALLGALSIAAALASAAWAAGGPSVTVTVKGTGKTLLKPTLVHGESGSITKGGAPKGKCPGASAAGALDAATHGRWTGTYSKSVGGIFVTSIRGVKPGKSHYWGFYVNGTASQHGICEVKLRAGEKLLFKITK